MCGGVILEYSKWVEKLVYHFYYCWYFVYMDVILLFLFKSFIHSLLFARANSSMFRVPSIQIEQFMNVWFFLLDMNIHTSAIKVHYVHQVVCLRCLFRSIENICIPKKRREKNWHDGKRRIKCLVDSVDIVVVISAASRTDSWLVD